MTDQVEPFHVCTRVGPAAGLSPEVPPTAMQSADVTQDTPESPAPLLALGVEVSAHCVGAAEVAPTGKATTRIAVAMPMEHTSIGGLRQGLDLNLQISGATPSPLVQVGSMWLHNGQSSEPRPNGLRRLHPMAAIQSRTSLNVHAGSDIFTFRSRCVGQTVHPAPLRD